MRGMRSLRCVSVFAVLCMAGAAGALAHFAVGSAALPIAIELPVRTHRGVERFTIIAPLADRSDAMRTNDDLETADGAPMQPTAGHALLSRVIVRAADAESVAAAASDPRTTAIAAINAAPGFWSVETATVLDAIAMADVLAADARILEAYIDAQEPLAERTPPTDPRYFTNQWTLNNRQNPLADANLEPAWDMGFTGAGVLVGICETGRWQTDHVDLVGKFVSDASQAIGSTSLHTTSVAGVVSMNANNGIFGAGAAYNAQLSIQVVSSSQAQADALGFRNDLNDIKNNSWGPFDDTTLRKLPSVVETAIATGIATGRGGLGEVYVWAAGNGGTANDRVDYDPYASSRHVICVGSVGDSDTRAIYNETGSAMTIVAHSDGNLRRVYTIKPTNDENTVFGGSSAAAPLASGIVALMLEANPILTHRDVQHILIRSARRNDQAEASWIQNGAARWVNYNYGYGAADAAAALTLALNWNAVGAEALIDSDVIAVNQAIPDFVEGDPNPGVTLDVPIADNIRVEHVEIVLNATTTNVGHLRIALTSPAGIESLLTASRSSDTQDNLVNHLFTSRRHWDEPSIGTWQVNIRDGIAGTAATWTNARVRIYGTEICNGDIDGDRDIDLADLATLLTAFGLNVNDVGYVAYADFDGDRAVTLTDLALLLQGFGGNCP
ncbi:MAG: S8 family serine peptidase [Phycisphaerae bacterium]